MKLLYVSSVIRDCSYCHLLVPPLAQVRLIADGVMAWQLYSTYCALREWLYMAVYFIAKYFCLAGP
jgi:hypothetical protein